MTRRSRSYARKGSDSVLRRIGSQLTFVVLVFVLWEPTVRATAKDDASASSSDAWNIVITSDSPHITARGHLQAARAYLSRSSAPLHSPASGRASAVLSIPVPEYGFYRAYMWWPQGITGAGDADVVVRHVGGERRIGIDQRVLGGQWNSLGVYEFSPGTRAEIRVTGRRGRFVIDAFRLEFMGRERPELVIETSGLPLGIDGAPYRAVLGAVGGDPPYRWTIGGGMLPAGLTLSEADGELSGILSAVGEYEFTVEVVDAHGRRATRLFALEVFPSPGEGDTPTTGRSASTSVSSPSSFELQATTAATAPDLSDLVNILAATPEGGWVKVNLNKYSDVWTPAELRPLDGLQPEKIILAWSSYAWDRNRGCLWLYGGGHANYSGNDVYRWCGATRRWERASLPSEVKQDDLGNWIAVDGPDRAPASAHTYDNNIFLPLIDRLAIFGGAAFNNGGSYLRQATATTSRKTGPYFFDPSRADPNKVGGSTGSHVRRNGSFPEILGGEMWANRDFYKNIATAPLPSSHAGGCTAYAEENGRDVVYVGANSGSTALALYRYTVTDLNNPALDGWEQVGRYWNTRSYIPACGYDPISKIFVKRGINTQPFAYWDLNTPSPKNNDVAVFPGDPTGEFPSLLSSNALVLKKCGLDFDPVRRNFVLWCGDGRVWNLTPPPTVSASGWVIRRQPAAGSDAVPNGDVGTGIIGKWKYIENLDAFLGLQGSTAGDIWLYKPFGWINPAGGTGANARPTVAIVEPADGATFAAGAPVTIAAEARDPDGTVARVEFFKDGMKLGQDSTSPYDFTWSNPPSGTFTLTAVAIDNAGAQTVSAPVTITVQPGAQGTVTLQQGLTGYRLARDTYLSSYHPTLPFGGATSVPDASTRYADLFHFAVFASEGGPVPDGATITSATLSIYKYTAYDMTYAVHRLLRPWSEDTATWQQRATGLTWSAPGAGGSGTDYMSTADAQAFVGWNPGWIQFDVTHAVQAMSAGAANQGWKLVPVSGYLAGLKRFHTKESDVDAALRPMLTITYTTTSP